MLALLEQLQLRTDGSVDSVVVSAQDLANNPGLRGAVQLHLDLVFRPGMTTDELMHTAAHGWLRIARHSEISGFPVGVALALPAISAVRKRSELFEQPVGFSSAAVVMLFAIATNPARVGAGAQLVRDLAIDCSRLPGGPRLVAFSPLTGLRARLMRLCDDRQAWSAALSELPGVFSDELREQLLALLDQGDAPDAVSHPARAFIASQAQKFVESDDYRAGAFHRSMGANLVGLAELADPRDGEAMWYRAFYEYHAL